MPTVPPLPKQYSSEMVCPNGDRVVLHVHDVMERMEIFGKAGPAKIIIRRPDKGVQWSLSSGTNTYMETVLPPALDSPPARSPRAASAGAFAAHQVARLKDPLRHSPS